MGFFNALKSIFKSRPKSNVPIIDVAKRFDLLGRTGQGSMSKVWRARDKMTGRTMCVKILDKVKTARFDARFPGLKRPNEGAVCMLLRHKNIVQTYEAGLTKQGEIYIMMELIDGVGLNFMIETKAPQLQGHRIDFLSQFSEGLEYVHRQGFLHRDICPRNVMITRENVVKIIDFGLAVPFTPEFCRPGNRTGTPNYLAPELIKRQTTDHRVDMFALGVTAYETFTGGLPWEKTESLQTLLSHMNSAGRDPRDVRPDLDKATVAFLIKGVERDPAARFQTPGEFREALQKLPKKW
ncbi:MAG: serine/threonine protein kinase [Gemmataceae bacterium]|nr:serine/threonine protein kinase [Gemmataceae bacterium]MCI0737401.1 serine/threonine protein kinase [Gemmataceae bacterium]